jgi:hypothetical protein
MATRTIRSLQELEIMRAYWEGWQSHPNSDFAHFQLVCGLRRDVLSPNVIIVERDGKPCALLAARLEHTRFAPPIGYFKPVRIPAKVLTVIYQGFLGQVNEEAGKALVRHLWSSLTSGEADMVTFHHLPEHSPLQQALLAQCPRLWREKKPTWSTHWTMSLPEEPGFLLRGLGSKHRTGIRKKQRELESAFPDKVSWRWMSRFDDIPNLCARLEVVAARTYQRGLGAGFVDDEEHRRRFTLFAGRGQLRVQLLEVGDKIRAFWIGTVYKNTFYSSDTGYDPDMRDYRPGTLIFIRMVDELVREGVRKFDFGLGDASYKQRFGNHCLREATVRLFAPTAKGLTLRSVLGFSNMLDGTARRLLQKAGVLDRLKTGWRRRLAPAGEETDEK